MKILLDLIKQDQLAARKQHNTVEANLLTTLIGEAELFGKNNLRQPTDTDIVQIVKKFLNGVEEVLQVIDTASDKHSVYVQEKLILSRYMPMQLSNEDLKEKISLIIVEFGKLPMGKVLAVLKDRYAGQYDGATAASIVKTLLT